MKTIKIILYYLGISNGFTGIWAYFFPTKFYTSFPGMGFHWVDITGPFNEHFIKDVGASFLAMSFLAIYAAARSSETNIRLACYGNLVFAVPHLIYHISMIHMFPTITDKVLGIFTLAISAILPAIILMQIKSSKKTLWYNL